MQIRNTEKNYTTSRCDVPVTSIAGPVCFVKFPDFFPVPTPAPIKKYPVVSQLVQLIFKNTPPSFLKNNIFLKIGFLIVRTKERMVLRIFLFI